MALLLCRCPDVSCPLLRGLLCGLSKHELSCCRCLLGYFPPCNLRPPGVKERRARLEQAALGTLGGGKFEYLEPLPMWMKPPMAKDPELQACISFCIPPGALYCSVSSSTGDHVCAQKPLCLFHVLR